MRKKEKLTHIRAGYYTVDLIASALLQAAGGLQAARKALTRASNKKPARTSDYILYLAAYHLKMKHPNYSDYTALLKLLSDKTGEASAGGHIRESHRRLWDKLKASGQTLEQITQPFRVIVTAIDKR